MSDVGVPGGLPPRPSALRRVLRILRKVGVAVVGGVVVVLGLALIVLPGPAIVVLPFGVAILATEFTWAQRLLLRIRAVATRAIERIRRSTHPRIAALLPQTPGSPVQQRRREP
jgi:uncharacterized protein (TIGR02611 family)